MVVGGQDGRVARSAGNYVTDSQFAELNRNGSEPDCRIRPGQPLMSGSMSGKLLIRWGEVSSWQNCIIMQKLGSNVVGL